ncbi:MAG: Cytochrome c1 heme lyase [Candelina mexicana]|nr:MAG: Cytochrome c1 heme lyase [Candelina mexicana]
MASKDSEASSACPVDPASRASWIQKAKQSGARSRLETAQEQKAVEEAPTAFSVAGDSCDSSTIDQTLPRSRPSPLLPRFTHSRPGLASEREISTIPRAGLVEEGGKPANNEQETGKDSVSGNWIYPSEEMFFNAMRRKNYDPKTEDMKAIVPIHNAVNERAWAEIKEWEKGRGAEACGGPRLCSFSGLSTSLSPKARFNTLLGYHAPFDRHDWIVDRCGTKVEYVIDFYAGKDEMKQGKSLNFYLDVRPKLNSFEGWKMRAGRLVGI